MRNQSDLAGVKSVAKMLLMSKVTKTDFSPMVVQHLFTNTGIIGIPSESGDPLEILDITAERKNLSRWRAIRVHVAACLYGEGEVFNATPEEVAYFTLRAARDELFFCDHCEDAGHSDFTFHCCPGESFGLEMN